VKAATVLVTVGVLLATLAGCGDGDDEKNAAPKCVGTDTPGSTHVLQSGPGPLPGGGRAIVTESHLDKTPPTVRMSLLGTDPGESLAEDVSVGSTVTVKGTKYSVVEICAGRVQLVKG
jgi:hypothetical protein